MNYEIRACFYRRWGTDSLKLPELLIMYLQHKI